MLQGGLFGFGVIVAIVSMTTGEYTCGGVYRNEISSFTSPGYPMEYPNNLDCTFIIDVPLAFNYTVTINEFKLENKLDFLYYGIGTNSSDIAHAKYLTGNVATNTFTLEAREIWLRFITDKSIGDKGFSISYEASVKTECNETQEITAPANITSLFWPDVYPEEVDCVYVIHASNESSGLTLSFDSFDIKSDDYLEISDGTSYTILRLNGQTIPKDFISRSNTINVTFHSEGFSNTTGSGFRMHVEDRTEVPLPKKEVISETLMPGIMLRLTSSNYPNPYASLQQQEFVILTSTLQPIVIDILDVDLEDGYDVLTISDKNGLKKEFTGNQVVLTPLLSADEVTITFNSDYSGSRRGFSLTLQELETSVNEKDSPPNLPSVTTHNYTHSVPTSGVKITSPNYPDSYPNNVIYTWVLIGNPEQRLKIDFSTFDLEYIYDVLIIGSGNDPTNMASRYAVFTGSNLPQTFVLDAEDAWIQFHADHSISMSGFELTVYPAVDCMTEYTLGDGEIYNLNFASPERSYCQWVIRVPRGKHIQLKFSQIEIYNLYETLEIGRGSNPANALSRQRALSGYGSVARSYLISDDAVWLAVTVRNIPSSFSVLVSDDGCIIESIFESQGVITSPSYPLPYPNDADCIWIIQITGDYRIHLTFHDFETEVYYDRLTIGGINDGPDRDYLELSGTTPPKDVYSNLNGLSLRFQSDGITTQKGFNISYNIIYNCPEGYIAGNDGETCYKFVHEPKSWYEARQDCLQTAYSDLVVIKDQQEAAYIQRYMQEADQNWWIGLSDLQEESAFVWVNCDYVPAGNLSWAPSEPTNSTSENCVRFNMDGHYIDDSCTSPFPYICKEEYKGFDSDEQNPSDFAVSFKTAHQIDLSWEPSPFNCYVSSYQFKASSNGSTVEDMTLDPSVMSVTMENLTSNTNYTFELVTMTFAEGILEESLTLSANTDIELVCPAEYQLNQKNNKCYKVNMVNMTWIEARQQCLETPDADLAIIDSERSDDILDTILQPYNTDFWFGLYDWNADDTWSHINSCRQPTYEEFINDDVHTEPLCAVKLHGDGWDAQPCNSSTNAYVCEYFPRDVNVTSLNPNFVRVLLLEPTTVQMYWTPTARLCDVLGYVVNSTKVGAPPMYTYVDDARSNAKVFYDLDMLSEYKFSVSAKTVTYGTLEPDVVETVLTGVECPQGYEEGFDSNCYKFVEDTATWNEARSACTEDGGYLIIINNNTELAYVRLKTRSENRWIGLNDQVNEGSWYWSDCSVSNSWQANNWAPGQPGNFNDNEHCGQVMDNGQWNDVNCERRMQYVCEIPKEGIDKNLQNPRMLNGTTIAYNRVNLTWTPSKTRCELIGYTITQTGKSVARYSIEGGDTSNAMIYGLEPNTVYTFRINAKAFYGDLPIVMDESVTLTTLDKLSDDCPYKYEKINGVCYKFSEEAETYIDAQKKCKEDDAVLVIINDQSEQDMIMIRTAGGAIWIGLNDQVEEGTFFWGDCSSISPWQALQWGDDEPSDTDGSQDCVLMSSGVWNDRSCDDSSKYVCEVIFGFPPEYINPTDFTGFALSAFSIYLTWRPSSYNCDVVEYSVVYSSPPNQAVIPGKNSDSAVISGLRPNTEYSFRISAFTALGNVEYSDPIFLTTFNFSSVDYCSGITFSDSIGNITSPNFPVRYPANANCSYIITLPDPDARVRLQFMECDLAGPGDYVKIMDINSKVDDPQMLVLSDTKCPKDYISMTNSVEIIFVSDSALQGSGFWIVYEEDKTALPVSKACHQIYTLKPGSSLRIQSTNYPNDYPNYENCTWTVNTYLSLNSIVINFFDVDLETGYDRLVFDDVMQTIVTGDVVPSSIISESFTLSFTMISDYSIAGRGFSLAIEEVAPELIKYKNTTVPASPVVQATCGGVVNVTSGSQDVTSPLFPKNYENNANCVWKIIGTENSGIVIKFNAFDLEYGYDYVLVGVGDNEFDTSSIVDKLSGPNIPSMMVVEGSLAWVQFVSDASDNLQGFDVTFSSKQRCGNDLTIPDDGSGVQIKSVNNPSPYDDIEYCLYKITAKRGSNIQFLVRSLDIEKGQDFLTFGTGPDHMDTSSRIFSLTGSMTMQSYYTKSNQLWITFISDATNTGDGYIIDAYNDACGISSIFDSSGQLKSPGYPLNYPNHADCTWIIQVSGGFHVELTFDMFDLETGRDFLIVGGITQDPQKDQAIILTGSDLPERIVSTSNGLNIQFITDASTTSSGFDLTWNTFYSCPEGYSPGNDSPVTCYKFSSESKSWLDARDDCLSTIGGDLVIINDKYENDYISSIIGVDDAWIGFYDQSREGEWFWVDCGANTDFADSNWFPGQPDGNGRANCAKMMSSVGMYDDQDCTTPVKYVCEQYDRFYNDDDAAPNRLQAEPTTSTSITLTWRAPNRYCDVLGYTVRYNGTNGDVEKSVSGSETNTIVIDNLLPDTTYLFELTSYLQSFGTLPYENSVIATTFKEEGDLCPVGWVVGPSFTCYKFSDSPKTWADARNDCLTIDDGDLAIINDQSELAYIQNMTKMNNTWWIGFYDQATEDSWRWIDCSVSSVWQRGRWASGQPDDSNGQSDCGQMNAAGQWEDENCSNMNNYICERRKKPFSPDAANPSLFRGEVLNPVSASFTWRPSRFNCDVTGYKINYQDGVVTKVVEVSGAETSSTVIRGLTPATLYIFSIAATTLLGDLSYDQFRPLRTLNESGVQCPPGYEIGYDYNCFKFSRLSRTWDEARADCQSDTNSDLAKLDTPEELNYVLNVRNTSADYWIGYYDVSIEGKWQWIDCTDPSNFTINNWASGEPNDVIGNQDCGRLRSDGKYYDIQCTERSQYICKVIVKDYVPEDFNPRLFTAVSFAPNYALLNWKPTNIYCDIIGYRIRYNSTNADGKVESVSGALTNSANITNLLPLTTYRFELAADLTTGPLPYQAVALATTFPEGDPCTRFGDWETGFDNNCYQFVTTSDPISWIDARMECMKARNGDLALVKSKAESEYIKNKTNANAYWIGYSDKAVEDDWRWLDCSPPSAWAKSYWLAGEPDDTTSQQNCGYFISNFLREGFGDDLCTEEHSQYICEVSDKEFDRDDANPSLFRGSALNPTTVELNWRVSDVICDIIGYKIEYYNPHQMIVDVPGPLTNTVQIGGLQDNTEYTFFIAAYNEIEVLTFDMSTTVKTPLFEDICPDGWEVGFDYKCYKYSTRTKTWQKARADCQTTPGGDLAIVNTKEEHTYVTNRTGGGNWWIGLHDISTEGDWSWIDCSSMSLWGEGNWGIDQPNDRDEKQDCGEIKDGGLFNDWYCDERLPYICKIVNYSPGDLNPTKFSGESQSPNDARLSWAPPSDSCEISSYKIFMNDGTGETIMEVTGGKSNSLTVKGLTAGTLYIFNIAVSTIEGNELERTPDTAAVITPLVGICGDTDWKETTGLITSPGFPKEYPNNQDCQYIISIPDADDVHSISLSFYSFDLEYGHDFLFIGSGDVVDSKIQYILTGSKVPFVINVNGGKMWVRFLSDEDKTATGFEFKYYAIFKSTTTEPTLVNPIEVGGTMITLMDESLETFNEEKRLKFAEFLADQANEYCSQSMLACLAPRISVYKSDNIVYYSFVDVNANLEVKFWISDPNNNEIVAMTTEQVEDMLTKNEDDSEFEYVIGPVKAPVPVDTSLEPWVITLISFFALCLAVIIVVAVINCNNSSDKTNVQNENMKLQEMESTEAGTSFLQRRHLSEHTSNVYFENGGTKATGETNSGFIPDTVPESSIAGASKPTGSEEVPQKLADSSTSLDDNL